MYLIHTERIPSVLKLPILISFIQCRTIHTNQYQSLPISTNKSWTHGFVLNTYRTYSSSIKASNTDQLNTIQDNQYQSMYPGQIAPRACVWHWNHSSLDACQCAQAVGCFPQGMCDKLNQPGSGSPLFYINSYGAWSGRLIISLLMCDAEHNKHIPILTNT